ncbi:MAG: ABC transporter substrate-binding protein [Deltaproteobacteria bacterium]|nr:MAG: ABC transporter substrate-binding protein [Deltaproteobacteria bacterium]
MRERIWLRSSNSYSHNRKSKTCPELRRSIQNLRWGRIFAIVLIFAFGGAVAQAQPAKVIRIGFLGPTSAASNAGRMEALRAGLRDLGYLEGKNLVIESRWAEGKFDRLPELAAELVRLNVDVILTTGTPGIRAAKNATTTIPIVMVTSGDPVGFGFVASLARPGGNITGSSTFGPELSAKRLELLKETLPRTQRVAVLFNPDNSINDRNLPAMEQTAKLLKIRLQRFEVRGAEEFKNAFAAMTKQRVDAVALPEDDFLNANQNEVAELVAKQRLPSIGRAEFAEAGGLIGYAVNFFDLYRRAAIFVDKILKGAKPTDLPVQQPTKFEFVINLKTAKQIGLTIPPNVLARADKVIR